MLIAFNISHTQNTKGHSGSEKPYSNFSQNFYFPNTPIWIKVLCNDCIICQLNKPYPNRKQIAIKQDFKGQSLYFNHRFSFDTKRPISSSSGVNFERNTITPLKSHIEAIQKLQPPTNKKKVQEFLGMLNFLSKYVYEMQLKAECLLGPTFYQTDLLPEKL